jgi:2-(1,2-epoxy-1,2-dihydrophenyl)acetyl-CoA isomerase
MTDQLKFEIADRIATITLNRPDRMNAFTTEMLGAWADALIECQRNDDVHVVILTGAGKGFCSGGDIGNMGDRGAQTPLSRKNELAKMIHRVPLAMADLDKPVIAALNGAAAGAGLDMALLCDLRYAAESARLGETYVRVGLVPGAGGTWTLPRRVGTAKALEMFWTGDLLDAREAERIGLVNKVLPDDELMPYVRSVAAKIAGGPQLSIRYMKRAVYQGQAIDFRTSLDLISSHYAVITSTDDHREAVKAFTEKRKPNFSGR